jgi:DNA-binding phage protein
MIFFACFIRYLTFVLCNILHYICCMEHEQWKILILLLKEIAKEKGITHWDIAIKTGMDRAYITHIFNLKNKPGIDIVFKIASAVGVNISIKTKDGEKKLNFERLLTEARKNYR